MNLEKIYANISQSLFYRVISNGKILFDIKDWKPILLLGLPLLLISLNDSWIFAYALREHIDCWIYLGYFLDLKQHLNTFAGTYYGTRLPWILPGFLAYRFFSPLVAGYVLHLVFYYVAIISLYRILKQTIGRRTALMTAVLMGGHYFFLESIGGDYIDGAALTYLFLSLLMLTSKARSNLCLRLCFAGVFYGCLIYTQLFMITYTPLLVLYYFFITRERKRLSHLTFFTLGFVGLTLFLCTVNYFLNGTFFFFFPIVQWTTGFVSTTNPWWLPISSWWKIATWLVLPILTFFSSTVILLFHRITRELPNRRFVLFFQGYFILNMLLHFIWQIKYQQPVLQLDYYSSYMLPAMFLAIGSQVAIVVHTMNRKLFYLLFGSVLAISFLPYAFSINSRWVDPTHFHPMLLTLFFGIAGLIAILIHYKKIAILLLSISLAILNVSIFNSRSWNSTIRDSAFQKHAFLSVIKSVQAVQNMDPQGNSLFWYNSQVPFGSIFLSVASTYLWGYRLVNDEFPQVCTKVHSRSPVLGERIFILSDDQNALEEANQNLAKIGLRGKFIDEKTILQGSVCYKITHLKIKKL